jgi:hypothetical protein
MSPEEICRRMGEKKTKSIFLELTTEGMKKVMHEAKLPTTRLGSHTSTKKRNDDWAGKLWRALADKPLTGAAATLLFEWLTKLRRPMLAEFLTALEVQHDGGLTDADFMQSSPPEKLQEAGKRLLEKHDRQEVAAYLFFLDATNKSEVFAGLELDGPLAGTAPSPGS